MNALVRNLRAIGRLAISQPLLTLAAVLVVAFAVGADTSTFNQLDASLSHAVGYSGPIGEPAIVGEIRPNMESVPPVDSYAGPDSAGQQDSASGAFVSTISISNSASDGFRETNGAGVARIANRTRSRAKTNPSDSLTIDIGATPVVAISKIRSVTGGPQQAKWASIRKPLTEFIGPDLSRLIADRISIDQTTIDTESSDSATLRKRRAKTCADIDAFARRFLARRSPVQMARPLSSNDGTAGGR